MLCSKLQQFHVAVGAVEDLYGQQEEESAGGGSAASIAVVQINLLFT